MKQIIVLFFLLIPISFNAETTDSDERILSIEKELQRLIGKVEILERVVFNLDQQTTKNEKRQIQNSEISKSDVFELKTQEFNEVEARVSQERNDKADYDKALSVMKEKKYDEAERLFGGFFTNHQDSQLLQKCTFWYAETFFQRERFKEAAINFLKSYKQNTKGEKAADSLLRLSASLSKIGKVKEACAILRKLENEFPKRQESSTKKAKDLSSQLKCG